MYLAPSPLQLASSTLAWPPAEPMSRSDQHDPSARPATLLDAIHDDLDRGRGVPALSELFHGLDGLRADSGDATWRAVREAVVDHDLRALIHQDPMTRRSFEKPRGYAGDAVLLDYIYRLRVPDDAPDVGRAVYDYAVGRPAARAVRLRREWLAHAIDRASDQTGGRARVLSVACGHLREAGLSAALARGGVERLVALDADAESLVEVERLGLDQVEPVEMSIGRLLARPDRFGTFDLSYSAGLYDYLEHDLACRLTASVFATLAPGGRLLVSNFLPTLPDAGYMETYMGWELIYRTEEQLASVADLVPEDEVAGWSTWSDPYGAIAYLEIERVGARAISPPAE